MCFREILGVNQDLSPQGVLVRQFPSAAQQAGASAVTQPCLSPTFRCLSLPFLVFSLPLRGLAPVPASYQPCDEKRASQRWVVGKTAGTVQLDGTTLCLHQNATMAGVELAPCDQHGLGGCELTSRFTLGRPERPAGAWRTRGVPVNDRRFAK